MEDRLKVLLIADRTDLFDSMPSIMNSEKYRVAIAANVNKAIALISSALH